MEIQGIEKTEKILADAGRVKNVLDAAAKAHQKGGVCYEATKALLTAYRRLKYDKLAMKVRETEAAFQEYEYFCGKQKNEDSLLEDLVAISDQRLLCWNTLQAFIDSGDPAVANALILFVDLSLQVLKKEEQPYAKLLEAAYITKKRNSGASEDIAGELGLARTTYYRERGKAIAALSEILFGYLGERHPDYMRMF